MTELKTPNGRPKGRTDTVPRRGRKLTPDQVIDIRNQYAAQPKDAKSFLKIQESYPTISRQNIQQIIERKIWKKLP